MLEELPFLRDRSRDRSTKKQPQSSQNRGQMLSGRQTGCKNAPYRNGFVSRLMPLLFAEPLRRRKRRANWSAPLQSANHIAVRGGSAAGTREALPGTICEACAPRDNLQPVLRRCEAQRGTHAIKATLRSCGPTKGAEPHDDELSKWRRGGKPSPV